MKGNIRLSKVGLRKNKGTCITCYSRGEEKYPGRVVEGFSGNNRSVLA